MGYCHVEKIGSGWNRGGGIGHVGEVSEELYMGLPLDLAGAGDLLDTAESRQRELGLRFRSLRKLFQLQKAGADNKIKDPNSPFTLPITSLIYAVLSSPIFLPSQR